MAQRLQANKRAAAERGELRTPLPVGLRPRRRRRDRHRPRRRGPGRDPVTCSPRSPRAGRPTGWSPRSPAAGSRCAPTAGRGPGSCAGAGSPTPGCWGCLKNPVLRRCLRVRPLHLAAHRRPRRHGAHRARRTAPRRVAGADQRPPRRLHRLGGLPGQRGQAGGQPHQRRRPPAAGGLRAVPGHHRLRSLRQADAHQLPHRPAARLRVLLAAPTG